MYTKPAVAEEIIKIISKCKQNKSPGHDDIGNLVVKRVARPLKYLNHLPRFLIALFQLVFSQTN